MKDLFRIHKYTFRIPNSIKRQTIQLKTSKKLDSYFTEDMRIAKKKKKNHTKDACVMEEMQMKATMRYHQTPTRTAKTTDTECWQGSEAARIVV